MTRFYFTYGTAGQAYFGGWSEVIAEDRNRATALFLKYHPKKEGSECVPCGGIYPEEWMRKNKMYTKGNFGHYAREIITYDGCILMEKRGQHVNDD